MANTFVLNTCIVFAVGVIINTSARSVPYVVDENGWVCEPRTIFKIDCNTCRCSMDGTTYSCTYMACPPALMKYLRQQQIPEDSKIPTSSIRKRSTSELKPKQKQMKPKRDVDDYEDPRYFLDAPLSESERYELEQQQRSLQQQQIADRRREQQELAAQQQELKKQAAEMKQQLEYQKQLDAQQRAYDEAQQNLDIQSYTYDPNEYYDQLDEDIQNQFPIDLQKSGYY